MPRFSEGRENGSERYDSRKMGKREVRNYMYTQMELNINKNWMNDEQFTDRQIDRYEHNVIDRWREKY